MRSVPSELRKGDAIYYGLISRCVANRCVPMKFLKKNVRRKRIEGEEEGGQGGGKKNKKWGGRKPKEKKKPVKEGGEKRSKFPKKMSP